MDLPGIQNSIAEYAEGEMALLRKKKDRLGVALERFYPILYLMIFIVRNLSVPFLLSTFCQRSSLS